MWLEAVVVTLRGDSRRAVYLSGRPSYPREVYFVAAIAATIVVAMLMTSAALRFDDRRERRWEQRDEFDKIVAAQFVSARARTAQVALILLALGCAADAVYELLR